MSNPQKWEYNWRAEGGEWDEGPSYALNKLLAEADKLGQNGWEMVNFTVVAEYSSSAETVDAMHARTVTRWRDRMWIASAMFKRPIAP